MTPKDKAEELTNRFYKYAHDGRNGIYYDTKIWTANAKQCALIVVDEILLTDPMIKWGESDSGTEYKSNDSYWQEVKQEIEKL